MKPDPCEFYLEPSADPDPEAEQLIFDGIADEAFKKKGMARIEPFRILVKDAKQSLHGGAIGITYYGCLYIDMLWVDETVRNQGFGRKLVEAAEKIARDKNCTFATLGTMDWEALPFYQKLGYEIEFVREGYENESKLYMLRKKL